MAAQEDGARQRLQRLRPWVLAILCAVALLVVCSVIGKPFVNPFVPHGLSGVSMAAAGDDAMVVVDQLRTRLLFVDRDQRIASIVETGHGDIPIDEVTDVAVGTDVVYVAGLTRQVGGEGIASESVLVFGLDGSFRSSIWETSDNVEHLLAPLVLDLEALDGGVVVTRVADVSSRSLQLLFIHDDGTAEPLRSVTVDEPICTASYDGAQDCCLIGSVFGSLYLQEASNDARAASIPGEMLCCGVDAGKGHVALVDGATGSLAYLEELTDEEALPETFPDIRDAHVAAVWEDQLLVATAHGTLLMVDPVTHEAQGIDSLDLAQRLAISLQAYVVSLIFLGVLLVWWVAGKISKLLKDGEKGTVLRIALAALVVVALILVSSITSYRSVKDSWDAREQELQRIASELGGASPSSLGDAAQRAVRNRGSSPSHDNGDYEMLREAVEGLALSAERDGDGVSCALYVVSADGSEVSYVLSSDRAAVFGERVTDEVIAEPVRRVHKASRDLASSDESGSEGTSAAISSQTVVLEDAAVGIALSPLMASDGTCAAVLEVSGSQLTFARRLVQDAQTSFLSFALVGVGAYLIVDEVLKYRENLSIHRTLCEQGVSWSFVSFSRTLMFLAVAASCMDTALVVVMTRNLFLSRGEVPSSLVLSVPFLAMTLGEVLSTPVRGWLSRYFSLKRVTLAAIAVAVLAQLLCFNALRSVSLTAFIVGRFFVSLGYEMTFATLYETVYLAQEPYHDLGTGVYPANVASRILAGILGGLVAQVDSVAIYLVSAFLGVLLFANFMRTLPSDFDPEIDGWGDDKPKVLEAKGEKRTFSETLPFIFSSQMLLTAAFGLVPAIIAGGYGSYLFPLFLSSSFLSDSQVANLWVVCEVIIYLVTNELMPLRRRCDRWVASWVALIGLGVTYELFSLNQSVSWAILASVVIGALRLFTECARSCAVDYGMHDFAFPKGRTTKIVENLNSSLKNLRSPAMGAFLSLGTLAGCSALGGYLAVSGILFALTTRSHRQRVVSDGKEVS